jgi:hypothetical protein
MIQANELRVGNIVDLYKGVIHYRTTYVYSISIEGINDEYGNSTAFFNAEDNSEYAVKPIPLTEEWLLRFGFKEEERSAYYDNSHRFLKDDFLYDLKDGSLTIAFSMDEGNLAVKAPYVHQLQNLYFALTGKELINNQ